MRLATNDVPVEFGGQVSQGEFRIKNSATAFAILSSGLYSNKYQAILRELGCNAYDSHVEAGYPEKPFTVHLPTRLNPIFSVRDYGVGLNHEQVMGLYTTYFESTKNDSNDFVGCMGLGSKSPFSYTKNFTITAIKDGTKGVYSAFIGDQGVPAIIQLVDEPTDEGNGVEVSFAVENRNDMSQFESEARKVYTWFQTKPEFTGVDVNIQPMKFAEENIIPGVNLREDNGYNNRSYALMGNVAYPIKVPEGEKLPKGVYELLHKNSFIIRFEIGTLDIAASREELGYVPHTIDAIAAKGEAIMDALGTYVENKIKPAKTKWERNKLAADLIESNRSLFGTIVENYVTKNSRQFVEGTHKQYNRLEISVPCADFEKVPGIKVTMKSIRRAYSTDKVSLINQPSHTEDKPKKMHVPLTPGTHYNPANSWNVFTINANTTTIIFNDEKGNVLQRIRQAWIDTDYKPLFNGNDNLFIVQAQNQTYDKPAMLKFLKKRFGNAPILLGSQLPSLSASASLGNQRVTVQQFTSKRGGRQYGSRDQYTFDAIYGKLKDIEPTITDDKGKKTFLYLKLSHKTILRPCTKNVADTTWDATAMMDMIKTSNIAAIANLDTSRIYGVNKTSFDTITKDKRWVSFFEYMEKEFDKIDWKSARKETEANIVNKQFKESSYHPSRADQASIAEIAARKSPAGIMLKGWLDWKAVIGDRKAKVKKKQSQIDYSFLIRVMQEFFPNKDFTKTEARLDVTKIEQAYNDMFENVEKTYPMLRHLSLSDSYYTSHWEEAIEYINLVDKAQNLC